MNPEIASRYGNRIRVRVGGLLFDREEAPGALLLVEHGGLWNDLPFWTPPGGEVDFGESLAEAAVREVREETGLDVEPGALLYTLDFVRPPLHAVSFYFRCRLLGGEIRSGLDPELPAGAQLIRGARFVSFEELPGLQIYPEGLPDALIADAAAGFPRAPRYLGTKR